MDDDKVLRTARPLPYSAGPIYDAFASPDLLARWWGPEGFSSSFEVFEFAVNGRWQFIMHGPDGVDYRNESRFVELVPETRIVIRHDCPPYFTLVIDLEADGDGTRLDWMQVFDDAATAQAVKKRVGTANEQNIDRLLRVLGEARAVG